MKTPLAWLLVLASMGLTGCEFNQYELDLRPNGPVMERQLTCWRVREKGNNEYELTKCSGDEIEAIAKVYPERLTKQDAAKQSFRGRFEAGMPNDIGGAGSYTYLTSSLGTTAAYVERFRGNDDVDTQFYDKRQVADRMTDLLLGWLESEMGQDPVFPAVRRLVHQDVRQDFRNVGLYCWLGRSMGLNEDREATGKELPEPWSSADEIHARVRQYLVERNYLLPHETLAGLRAEVESGEGQVHVVVQRVLARKLGLSDPEVIQRALGFMSDQERVQESIVKYLETTPEFQRRLKRWESEVKKNSAANRPKSGDILSELTMSLLEFELLHPDDKLHVTLKVPSRPYQTNGDWNQAGSLITWNKQLRKGAGLPPMCVASWDEPDVKFQTAHLGRVMLTGEELSNYNVWRRAISAAQGTQWDDFLAGLKPAKDAAEIVAAFEFTGEAKPKEKNPKKEKVTIQGRDMLVEALKKGE